MSEKIPNLLDMEIITNDKFLLRTNVVAVEYNTVEECLEKVKEIVEKQLELLKDKKTISHVLYVEGWHTLNPVLKV